MNRLKVNRLVEYIKQFEFVFETDEVVESLYDVLAHYGIANTDLTNQEEIHLISDLLPLAEQFEFREVSRLALEQEVVV